VSWTLIPAFRKELDAELGFLSPRAFEAKNDKRACAEAHAASPAAVARLIRRGD